MKHFDFSAFRHRFQKVLLSLLKQKLTSSKFKKFNSLKSGIEYVTRYCGRVPISENRIINYDGENITFSYIVHEDNSYHEVTVSADKFIFLLARHIVPP